VFIDNNGTPMPLSIYDEKLWQRNKWSIYSDESQAIIQKEAENGGLNAVQISKLFIENLNRAYDFQLALSKPMAQAKTQIALFGGDCDLTNSRAVINQKANRTTLAFAPNDVQDKVKNVNYNNLMQSPGDGLVTRESQLARASTAYLDTELQKDLFPIAQTTFFCESHELLTGNPYFQNNLLYFLFH
jgi:hypothetical protein